MARGGADGGVAVAAAGAAGENLVLFADRRPARGRRRAEQRNRRHAQPGGEMQRPGVAGNKNLRPRQHGEKQRQLGNRAAESRRVGRELFQFRHQRGLAFAARGGEDHLHAGGGGQPVQRRPVRQRPFFFRLARRDMANDGAFVRQNFFGGIGQRGIGVDFRFQRAGRRNLPAGQKLRQPRGFVRRICSPARRARL